MRIQARESSIAYPPTHYDYVALIDLKKDEKALSRYGIKEVVESIEPISIIKLPNYGKYPAKDVVEKLGVKDQGDREKLDEATRIVYREEFYNGVMKENTLFPGLSVNEARERTIKALSEQVRGVGCTSLSLGMYTREVVTPP